MNQISVNAAWKKVSRIRRIFLIILLLSTTVIACLFMSNILPHKGSTGLEVAMILVFGALFAWISIGFWTAMAGFVTLMRKYDRFSITSTCLESNLQRKPSGRTAILIPICNEDVERLFIRLRITYQSLEATGRLQDFDFFILSDSTDPDTWVEEEAAWAELCQTLGAVNQVFYRHRRVNLKYKSGNIADFCRRWGKNYHYMIVFDADSMMTGTSLIRMVQVMEQNQNVGILQTAPLGVNRESVIARVQQFANHVYGPIFGAGLNFIQLGDSHFWGHNAIIRIAPFMKHCSLPRLSGKPPLGGNILSHDFVEAALMRRAGWEVWLAYDLEGSYEEMPPTLLEELKRDRRWCQGNIQHMRLLFSQGLFPAHRALFLHGAMAYVSALLWFLFLSLSTAEAIVEVIRVPDYFPVTRSLFPTWPVWHPQWALTLLASTGVILFLPKFLSLLLIIFRQRRSREFGGTIKLFLSVMMEIIFSFLLAPIRMLFHSKFVFITLLGRQVGWTSQQRSEQETSWLEATRFHFPGMVLGLIWGTALFFINRSFFWWNTPIIVPLILSIPLSVLSSSISLGKALRKLSLLLIPEEINPPWELQLLQTMTRNPETSCAPISIAAKEGFIRAVVDPNINALHRSLLRGKRKYMPSIIKRRQEILEKALTQGSKTLSSKEKKELLLDPQCLLQLHERLWETSDNTILQKWGFPPEKSCF
ncbi:MAG TPA: glucans biosynthesis glucosyltransferase MdoH [Thermodesulfobacteriota bacterium]|nr:glucans biosynthesis glucosyltransferase MdoH [Thermodesulfobacteriota bacterium]